MKTYFTLLIALLITISTFAQQGINYKALIKDDLGNVQALQTIGVQFQIRETTANGSAVYTETHTENTDANGILVLTIGAGDTSDTFSAIDWSSNKHWLNLQIDITGGTNYADMSTTEFMAVPYAKYAERATIADNVSTKIDDLTDGKSDANGSSLFIGLDAGLADDGTNNNNVGVGYEVLKANTNGSSNTANGFQALYSNTTGGSNTANGFQALYSNTTGGSNTANGLQALFTNTTGYVNTAIGYRALYSNTSGYENTANGFQALYSNTTGYYNTANGVYALSSNTRGSRNTATGHETLTQNTTGSSNTANGHGALYQNTTGHSNTANGIYALNKNTTGTSNVAVGSYALAKNTTASYCTAIGFESLSSNTSGHSNTANGGISLASNTTGNANTANGYSALNKNTTGDSNTAIGVIALFNNTTGSSNIAIGGSSLVSNTTGYGNTAVGRLALSSNISGLWNTASGFYALKNNTTGENNIAIGSYSGLQNVTGSNNIFIGNYSGGTDQASNNKLYINNEASDSPLIYGDFDLDLIRVNGSVVTGGPLTIQNASDASSTWRLETRPNGSLSMYRNGGYLGFFSASTGNYSSGSDRRIKKDITSLENGTLNKVMQLNPVSYLMKDQTDTNRNLGLISQEVQEIFPSITHYVKESDLLTLSYTELIPILIKALQEQQGVIDGQQITIEGQKAKDVVQDKSIEALVARLNAMESKSSN